MQQIQGFQLESEFVPTGDQPEAVEKLVEGVRKKKIQTLLGVTGSGKTFTVANVIQQTGKNTLVISHNKTLAAQLYSELKQFFPKNNVGCRTLVGNSHSMRQNNPHCFLGKIVLAQNRAVLPVSYCVILLGCFFAICSSTTSNF